MRYEPELDGKTYIAIGNKVFVTTGTYANPKAEDIIEFDDMEEMDEFIERIASEDIW